MMVSFMRNADGMGRRFDLGSPDGRHSGPVNIRRSGIAQADSRGALFHLACVREDNATGWPSRLQSEPSRPIAEPSNRGWHVELSNFGDYRFDQIGNSVIRSIQAIRRRRKVLYSLCIARMLIGTRLDPDDRPNGEGEGSTARPDHHARARHDG